MRTRTPPPERKEVAPGVTWCTQGRYAIWRGSAQALIDFGIVKAKQLPGMPGNGRNMSSYNADGTKPRQGNSKEEQKPGRMTIVTRTENGKNAFGVRVLLPKGAEAKAPTAAVAVLPALETQDAIDTVLDDLRKLDNSINVLAKLPAPASRVTAASLKSIREARTQLQATIATADWEVA